MFIVIICRRLRVSSEMPCFCKEVRFKNLHALILSNIIQELYKNISSEVEFFETYYYYKKAKLLLNLIIVGCPPCDLTKHEIPQVWLLYDSTACKLEKLKATLSSRVKKWDYNCDTQCPIN